MDIIDTAIIRDKCTQQPDRKQKNLNSHSSIWRNVSIILDEVLYQLYDLGHDIFSKTRSLFSLVVFWAISARE